MMSKNDVNTGLPQPQLREDSESGGSMQVRLEGLPASTVRSRSSPAHGRAQVNSDNDQRR
uniref:Uncharacterized protein n=1 Tax=Parascaris equorum TaxID=6256 RepID=A0A914RSZ8_PAREQ